MADDHGAAGVTRCLEIIRKELDVTMALCGLRDVRDVDGKILVKPMALSLDRS